MQIQIGLYKRFGPIVQSTNHRNFANIFHGKYSFLNLEIVENSKSCHKFQFFSPNILNFCCGNLSMKETIQGCDLFAEIQKWYNCGGSSSDCIKKQINLLIIVVKWLGEGEWIWTWLVVTHRLLHIWTEGWKNSKLLPIINCC